MRRPKRQGKVFSSVLDSLFTIAEAKVADAAPPTSGQIVAGLLTLFAIVLSCVTVVRCLLRARDGQIVMPVAKREPLHVPIPLAILGVIVATMLASAATLSSFDELMAEQTEVVNTEQPENSETNGTTIVPLDTVDSQIPENEITNNEGEENKKPDADGQSISMMALRIVKGTLGMNTALLLLFGIAVWMVQADGPGRAFRGNDLTADDALEDLQNNSDDRNPQQPFPTDHFAAGNSAGNIIQEPWNLFAELKFASMAFLMALVPTFAARLIMLSFMEQPKSHQFITMIQSGTLSAQLLVLLLLIATIVAPVVEELLYRVVVLGGLKNRRSSWVAIAVSSVLFSFAHGFPDSISLLPLAFVLGYTYTQRRSYRTVMLVHLIFNSFNMVLLLIQLS